MARHFFQKRKSRLWHASRYRIQQLADLAASRAERVRAQLADADPPRGLRRASAVLPPGPEAMERDPKPCDAVLERREPLARRDLDACQLAGPRGDLLGE